MGREPFRVDEIPDKLNAAKNFNTIPALLQCNAIAVMYTFMYTHENRLDSSVVRQTGDRSKPVYSRVTTS